MARRCKRPDAAQPRQFRQVSARPRRAIFGGADKAQRSSITFKDRNTRVEGCVRGARGKEQGHLKVLSSDQSDHDQVDRSDAIQHLAFEEGVSAGTRWAWQAQAAFLCQTRAHRCQAWGRPRGLKASPPPSERPTSPPTVSSDSPERPRCAPAHSEQGLAPLGSTHCWTSVRALCRSFPEDTHETPSDHGRFARRSDPGRL